MIYLEKIKIKNFLSFGENEQEFHFASNGIHLIKGKNLDTIPEVDKENNIIFGNNGAGKSSLILAVQYALFGVVRKTKVLKRESLINKNCKNSSFLKVELFFSKLTLNNENKKEKYRVVRIQKLKGNPKYAVYLYKLSSENSEIDENWIDLTKSDVAETQKLLDSILSFNERGVFFSREDISYFLHLSSNERIKIIEDLIYLFEKFRKKYEELKSIAREISNFKIQKSGELNSFYLFYKNSKKEINNEIQKIRQQTKTLLEEKKELENKFNFLKTIGLENLSYEIEKAKKYLSIEEEILKIKKEIEKISKENSLLKNELQKNEKNLSSIEQKIKKEEEKLNENKLEYECLKCGYKHYSSNSSAKNNELLKEYLKIKKQIEDTISFIKEKIKKNFEEEISSLKEKEKKLEQEISNFSINSQFLEMIKSGYLKDFESISEKFQILAKKEEFLQLSKKQNIQTLWERYKKYLKNYLIEKEKFKQILNNLEKIEYLIEILDFYNENSIKQFLLSKIIPVLNNLIMIFVKRVFDNNLEIYLDNFLEAVILKNGKEYEYYELSTGEKNKLNLCINLAIFELMRLNLGGCNILFLDEIFVNIDENSILKFIDILKKINENTVIYLISHDYNLFNNITFDSSIIIQKKDDNSVILSEIETE